MAYISQSSIQELTDRLDSIMVMSDYVHLEKKGGRWWACCPFHQEKTASFTVNPERKTYYCFGCQKGGTVISFVMEMEKITFPEAIELLAKKCSVELVYDKSRNANFSTEDEAKKKQKDELFELYSRISGTFHHFLQKKPESHEIKQYIIARGISIDMIERFRLGYAPADRYWLHKFLINKGYSKEFLASSGLFSSRFQEASLFSGRLMFPIADRQGRIVAFGGRIMPGQAPKNDGREPPKYINSPELGIYKKGETLYAADLALPEIRKTKTAYIAEGYMDVIALHQAGITNSVAPLGTAFTDEQARLLQRWGAEKVILFFDSDDAGQAAALKGISTCRKNGLEAAVIMPETGDLTGQKDPADILCTLGAGALQKKAKCFINDFDYLITKARSFYDVSGPGGVKSEGKARAAAFLFPYIRLLDSEVARESCIESAADAIGLLPNVVADDYRRYASEQSSPDQKTFERPAGIKEETYPRLSGGRTGSPIHMNDELSLLLVVAINYVFPQKERLFPKFRAALEINDIQDSNAKELFIAMEECIRYGETGMDELLERISSPELKKIILERSTTGEYSINVEQYVSDGIKKIEVKQLEHKKDEMIHKLRLLKNNSSEEDRKAEEKELLAEIMRIDKDLYQLKQGR